MSLFIVIRLVYRKTFSLTLWLLHLVSPSKHCLYSLALTYIIFQSCIKHLFPVNSGNSLLNFTESESIKQTVDRLFSLQEFRIISIKAYILGFCQSRMHQASSPYTAVFAFWIASSFSFLSLSTVSSYAFQSPSSSNLAFAACRFSE